VKEADALSEAGYEVVMIYQYWTDWATDLDKQLLKERKWKAIRVGGDPIEHKLHYSLGRISSKLGKVLFKVGIKRAAFAGITRSSRALVAAARKHKADLYIGHNMGALRPALAGAKIHGSKCIFDAEDFHRNESSNDPLNDDVQLKTFLENRYFPSLDLLNTASPLISAEYEKLFPGLKINSILNVFPKISYNKGRIRKEGNLLKLFWFSQTIGFDRGLEDIIKAMVLRSELNIELHLLGDSSKETKDSLIALAGLQCGKRIFFYEPIPSDHIASFSMQFDVGLATETGTPYNREICLTNKLFIYIQSGLSVLASDTKAQQLFLSNYPSIGNVYQRGNVEQVISILDKLYSDSQYLTNQQQEAFKLGQQNLNWEFQSQSFLSAVCKIIA
jgi:hypothetical protein